MLFAAEAMDSRYIRRTLSLPSSVSSLNTCARERPTWAEFGIIRAAKKHLGVGLHPVVAKRRLHLATAGPFDSVMGVAPVILRAAVSGPGVSNADSARESGSAVDHQQLAMGAIVQARQIVPAQRMIPLHLDPGRPSCPRDIFH